MVESNKKSQARRVLAVLLESLDGDHIYRTVVEPIEKSARDFVIPDQDLQSHRDFNRLAGRFVQHVYAHALRLPIALSLGESVAVAVGLLQQGYESGGARGYEAALLDARDPVKDGIGLALSSLQQIIAGQEVSKYVNWVVMTNLRPCDWETRCCLVELIFDVFGEILPDRILQCAPAQLTEHIYTLISHHLSSNREIMDIFAGNANFQ